MDEKISLWNKRMEDLTFGDYIKINGIVLGVYAGAVVAGVGWGIVNDKLQTRRLKKQNDRNNNIINTTCVES